MGSSIKIPFANGKINISSVVFKLAGRLGLSTVFMLADYCEKKHSVDFICKGISNEEEALHILWEFVEEKPHLWERMLDNSIFEPDTTRKLFVPFKMGREFFLFGTSSRKVFKVNGEMYYIARSILIDKHLKQPNKERLMEIYRETGILLWE